MESDIKEYELQLQQVELALSVAEEGEDKYNLLTLQADLKQLIQLTLNTAEPCTSNAHVDTSADDEYALFMSEMAKFGAIETNEVEEQKEMDEDIEDELKSLEGMKCRAPHKHTWGDTVFHNAIVCTVLSASNEKNFDNIEVKIMFTNPTHQEMLPCPYLLDSDCKFAEDNCRYSHGEVVLFSQLEDYLEPNYDSLTIGSLVLAKKNDKLWYRATIKRIFKDKCLVKFESITKEVDVPLVDIFPLNEVNADSDESEDNSDLINMSLMLAPSTEKLGNWEKFTNGIGSKLMEKMGYVVGTGLGRRSDGRLDPVEAIVLPAGKSLDHCMELREKAGGDKNLFSVERKLLRIQRKVELKNQMHYEREKNKVDVFNFLNNKLNTTNVEDVNVSKSEHRKVIKKETSRNLNVEGLKVDENIRDVERELTIINECLGRHKDKKSQVHKQMMFKLNSKEVKLKQLKNKALNIKNEQNFRTCEKKLTIF